MHLIQILLPLYDNAGNTFGEELYGKVRRELTERFGGLTAFTRAPAQGLWKDAGQTKRDDIVVFEVMTNELDADWWRAIASGWKPLSARTKSSSARSRLRCCNYAVMAGLRPGHPDKGRSAFLSEMPGTRLVLGPAKPDPSAGPDEKLVTAPPKINLSPPSKPHLS